MKVAFKSDASHRFVSLTAPGGLSDSVGPGETFEVILLEGELPTAPTPNKPPSEAGWWGPTRAHLFSWVWDHYLTLATRTVANVEYWVGEILKHPGDDPDPHDNEGYWIGQMKK